MPDFFGRRPDDTVVTVIEDGERSCFFGSEEQNAGFRHRSSWASVMPKHNPYSMFLSILNEVILESVNRGEP